MARALHIWIKGEQIDWNNPPRWAQLIEANPVAVWLGPEKDVEPETARTPTPKHSRSVDALDGRDGGNWINHNGSWF